MNRFIGIGNVVKTPELRETASGKAVCSFTIAINRNFGEKKEVDYINVVTWGKTAESCAKYLDKGKKVGVSGRIQVRSYEANDGTKRYATEIVADDVEFLSPKALNDAEGGHREGDNDFEPIDSSAMPF